MTRQALNRLRTLSRRREEHVGEWFPQPLLTSPDVAEALDTSREAVRQIYSSGSRPCGRLTPRMEVSSTEQRQVLNQFRPGRPQQCAGGLMDVFAGDVVLISDGGGKVLGFRPVEGAKQVAVDPKRNWSPESSPMKTGVIYIEPPRSQT